MSLILGRSCRRARRVVQIAGIAASAKHLGEYEITKVRSADINDRARLAWPVDPVQALATWTAATFQEQTLPREFSGARCDYSATGRKCRLRYR